MEAFSKDELISVKKVREKLLHNISETIHESNYRINDYYLHTEYLANVPGQIKP
jgi:hypothetical protein